MKGEGGVKGRGRCEGERGGLPEEGVCPTHKFARWVRVTHSSKKKEISKSCTYTCICTCICVGICPFLNIQYFVMRCLINYFLGNVQSRQGQFAS